MLVIYVCYDDYYVMIISDDRHRVVLQQQLYGNVSSSDYINAIYVEVTYIVILYMRNYCFSCII